MRVRSIISYLGVLAVAVLFMLFLDGIGGAFFTAALVLAPILSLLLALSAKKSVSCTVRTDICSPDRGDEINITLTVVKKGFMPTSFVTARLYLPKNISTDRSDSYRFAFGFGPSTSVVTLRATAALWGRAVISVSELRADDLMGLFGVSIPVGADGSQCAVSISPRLAGCNIRSDFMKQLTEATAFDDSEETTSDTNVSNGTPGYEHRKYIPGDSMRQINWKLSAKRDELLVRKPEGVKGAPQTLILDMAHGSDLYAEQTLLEGILSVSKHFCEAVLPCRLFIMLGGEWECIEFQGVGDVEALRFRMTELSFGAADAERLPDFSSEHIGGAVVFTARPDSLLSARLGALVSQGCSVKTVAAAYSEPLSCEMWRIASQDNEYDFFSA